MKTFIKILASLALLGGCAPLSIYYKPGVSIQNWSSDTDRCAVSSLRDAPVAHEVRQTPPTYVPPRQTCDSNGTCTQAGGYWLPGNTYTVDVNASLRERLQTRCMAKKGYEPVEIPNCPSGLKAAGSTKVLPQLTEKSCAIRNDDGSFLIVNRS